MLQFSGAILLALSLLTDAQAQKCAGVGEGTPVVAAKGFTSYLLATGLNNPRGMVFDKEGNLLVSQRVTSGSASGNGIYGLKLKDDGGCVSVVSKDLIVPHPPGVVGRLLFMHKICGQEG